jgi:hypothetical protein
MQGGRQGSKATGVRVDFFEELEWGKMRIV